MNRSLDLYFVESNLFHASVKDKTEMQESGSMNTRADGQQNPGRHPEAGPLEDEHSREGGGRETGLDMTTREEDSRWGQTEEEDRFVSQIFVLENSS